MFSAKTKNLIEGIISLGLMSKSKFMARLSDWMGDHDQIGGTWPDAPLDPPLNFSGDPRGLELGKWC